MCGQKEDEGNDERTGEDGGMDKGAVGRFAEFRHFCNLHYFVFVR